MKSSKSFALGLVVGIGFSAVTAFAATRLWTAADVKDVNSQFSGRSGYSFTLATPENDAKEQTLAVHVKPHAGLVQRVLVNPGDQWPPGPCFTARVQPSPDTETPGVTLQVLEPDAITLLDADGNPAALCPAP
jgi:hypothetical protein